MDGEVVQHIEYVPFGEVFIEERNNTWNTPYLFNAKELDEETGLYYYGARYYNPRTSVWLSTDPLQEKYPNISTYAYCINNPVKFIDPDGMDWVTRIAEKGDGKREFYYDRSISSQEDVIAKYGKDAVWTEYVGHGTSYSVDGTTYTFYNDLDNNKNGTVLDQHGNAIDNIGITENGNVRIFGVTDNSLDAGTLYKNYFGSIYIGPNNPKNYDGFTDNYEMKPFGLTDAAAKQHDLDYDFMGASGKLDAFTNRSVYFADRKLADSAMGIMHNKSVPQWDRDRAKKVYMLFNFIANRKEPFGKTIEKAVMKNMTVPMPYSPLR